MYAIQSATLRCGRIRSAETAPAVPGAFDIAAGGGRSLVFEEAPEPTVSPRSRELASSTDFRSSGAGEGGGAPGANFAAAPAVL